VTLRMSHLLVEATPADRGPSTHWRPLRLAIVIAAPAIVSLGRPPGGRRPLSVADLPPPRQHDAQAADGSSDAQNATQCERGRLFRRLSAPLALPASLFAFIVVFPGRGAGKGGLRTS
jgi:hypothetical protein